MTWNAHGFFDDYVSFSSDDDLDLERRIRGRMEVARTWKLCESYPIPQRDQGALLRSPSVESNLAGFEERLHTSSTQTRDAARQDDIEPLANIVSFDFELKRRHAFLSHIRPGFSKPFAPSGGEPTLQNPWANATTT